MKNHSGIPELPTTSTVADRPWTDPAWLNTICVEILSGIPRLMTSSKTEMTTRVLQKLQPATPRPEASLMRSLTQALNSRMLDNVAWVPWRHPCGRTAHAVFLSRAYPQNSAALDVLNSEVRSRLSLGSWVARGKLAEHAVANTLRNAGFTIDSYESTGITRAGRLDRAVDLAIVADGEVVVGIEVKNHLTATLHGPEGKFRDLAQRHCAMGALYVVITPAATRRFTEQRDHDGSVVIETGTYLVEGAEAREQLLDLDVPYAVEVATTGSSHSVKEATLPPRVADLVITKLLRLARPRPTTFSIPAAPQPQNRLHDRYRQALTWHASGHCMACGMRRWADGTCVMRSCTSFRTVQDHPQPRQELLADAVGVTPRTLREIPKALNTPAPWKGQGRPRSENRKSSNERPYMAPGWWEAVMTEIDKTLSDGRVTNPTAPTSQKRPVTKDETPPGPGSNT